MGALLRVVDLHKTFGTTEVLKGIHLEVELGETVTIIGPSGSGKTTLLRCINYLERPTSGHIYIGDRLIGEHLVNGQYRPVGDRELARERTEIGMVFQRFNLFPHLTALENVTLGPLYVLKQPRAQVEAQALALLEKVGLAHKAHEYPERLSGGQQQRVAIARAVVAHPQVLLADEPTGNLDTARSREIMELLTRFNRERGLTIVMVTHEPDMAAYAGRVVRFRDGAIEDDRENRREAA